MATKVVRQPDVTCQPDVADAQLEVSVQRLLAYLREQDPALYATVVDCRGRPRRKALTMILRERLDAQHDGTKPDFLSGSSAGILAQSLVTRA